MKDTKAKRKIHPLATACFIISLVPVVLIAFGYEFIKFGPDPRGPFPEECRMIMLALYIISFFAQPLGILLGIRSLVHIRIRHSYCGKGFAIAGIIISTALIVLVIVLVIMVFHFPALWLR